MSHVERTPHHVASSEVCYRLLGGLHFVGLYRLCQRTLPAGTEVLQEFNEREWVHLHAPSKRVQQLPTQRNCRGHQAMATSRWTVSCRIEVVSLCHLRSDLPQRQRKRQGSDH